MGSTKMTISFWRRLFDMFSPRPCVACGNRLGPSEEVLCGKCNIHLGRTNYAAHPYDNEMTKSFWGRIAIEKAAALFFYQPQSQTAQLIYNLKYRDRAEYGVEFGEMTAREFMKTDFFEGIDGIVPVPLTKERERARGYNQSEQIAKGVGNVTGIPVLNHVVVRKVFHGSQIDKHRWQRNENVENVFLLVPDAQVDGKHLLIVDDIVTTGATVCACVGELQKGGTVKVSVLALGFTKA